MAPHEVAGLPLQWVLQTSPSRQSAHCVTSATLSLPSLKGWCVSWKGMWVKSQLPI